MPITSTNMEIISRIDINKKKTITNLIKNDSEGTFILMFVDVIGIGYPESCVWETINKNL
jgi:hypothetical protein